MQRPNLREIKNPLIVIGIGGCLHLVNLCLRYIPKHQRIIFISNGLSEWENEWARNNLRFDGFLQLHKRYYHANVIDFLLSYFRYPFGIIDYDCFVFDPSYFQKLHQLNTNTLLNSAFVHHNPSLDLDLPETFLLFFNTKIIRSIQRKYKVDSKPVEFSMLSRKVLQSLNLIGITGDCYPEEYKNYFDTLRLWVCLGIAEGYKCDFIAKYSNIPEPGDAIYHVGSGSSNSDFRTPWRARGTYFWRRALEECNFKDLQKEYWEKFGNIKASELIEKYPDVAGKLSQSFYNQVERIIN